MVVARIINTESNECLINSVTVIQYMPVESKTPCYYVNWDEKADITSYGSPTSFTVDNAQDCRDWCLTDPTCVGVDVVRSQTPVQCWPHYSVVDYEPDNLYSQPGTASNQLLCANISVPTGKPPFFRH